MPSSRVRPSRATVGLVVALALVVLACTVPALTGWQVWSRAPRSVVPHEAPPLHGWWRVPRLGAGTIPAVLLGLLGWRYGPGLAERLSWRRLLLASYGAALAWLLALATVDGTDGLTRALDDQFAYLPSARQVTNVHALLQGYVARIPIDSPHAWPTDAAGHPPGALLFFVVLARSGLGSALAVALVITAVAATTAVAVLVAVRALGAEAAARRAAPFLVLTPAAVFMAVSGDALFGALAAWGLACLALGATSPGRRWLPWSVLSGLLLGWCVMSSYGLPLLGVLAVAVLVLARSWRPLPVAAVAALVVVLAFAAGGFAWWEAFPVLRDRYWDGVAHQRPGLYWTWANLAALVVCAGPVTAAALAQLRRSADRVVVVLASAALASVVLADLSQMSRAEVERIWLPFVPWLVLSTALLPPRWRRWGLLGQVGWALVVQHVMYTTW